MANYYFPFMFLKGLLVLLSLHLIKSRSITHPVYYNGEPEYYGQHFSPQPGYFGHPYLDPYDPYQSPVYPPPGTFYDRRRKILRTFPGGGVPMLVDYHKRCSGNYLGIKPHPDQHQYYYVCRPDCVIFGKCQNLQTFNTSSRQCAPYPISELLPGCTKEGRFPIASDCTIYYKCDCGDAIPRIYSCPPGMVFSPERSKCVGGNQCAPTQISTNGSYIPENCERKFPPCKQNGTFRSSSDCSLYYNCCLQNDGVYLQTRYKCAKDYFYDVAQGQCLPQKEVSCDCVQVAEIVYPRPPPSPYYPAIYPPYYASSSIQEHSYPTEKNFGSCSGCTSKPKQDGKNTGNAEAYVGEALTEDKTITKVYTQVTTPKPPRTTKTVPRTTVEAYTVPPEEPSTTTTEESVKIEDQDEGGVLSEDITIIRTTGKSTIVVLTTTKEPITTSTHEPNTTEESTTTGKTSLIEMSTTTEEPSTTEESTTTTQSSTTQQFTTTASHTTTTEETTTTEMPTSTEVHTTTSEEITTTKDSTTTVETTSTVELSTTTQAPTTTESATEAHTTEMVETAFESDEEVDEGGVLSEDIEIMRTTTEFIPTEFESTDTLENTTATSTTPVEFSTHSFSEFPVPTTIDFQLINAEASSKTIRGLCSTKKEQGVTSPRPTSTNKKQTCITKRDNHVDEANEFSVTSSDETVSESSTLKTSANSTKAEYEYYYDDESPEETKVLSDFTGLSHNKDYERRHSGNDVLKTTKAPISNFPRIWSPDFIESIKPAEVNFTTTTPNIPMTLRRVTVTFNATTEPTTIMTTDHSSPTTESDFATPPDDPQSTTLQSPTLANNDFYDDDDDDETKVLSDEVDFGRKSQKTKRQPKNNAILSTTPNNAGDPWSTTESDIDTTTKELEADYSTPTATTVVAITLDQWTSVPEDRTTQDNFDDSSSAKRFLVNSTTAFRRSANETTTIDDPKSSTLQNATSTDNDYYEDEDETKVVSSIIDLGRHHRPTTSSQLETTTHFWMELQSDMKSVETSTTVEPTFLTSTNTLPTEIDSSVPSLETTTSLYPEDTTSFSITDNDDSEDAIDFGPNRKPSVKNQLALDSSVGLTTHTNTNRIDTSTPSSITITPSSNKTLIHKATSTNTIVSKRIATTTQAPHTTSFNTSNLEIQLDNSTVEIRSKTPIQVQSPVIHLNYTAAPPAQCGSSGNSSIPKLEVRVFDQMDLRIIYCPRACNVTHNHQFDPSLDDTQAVAIKWSPGNSRKTMSLETVNMLSFNDTRNKSSCKI